MNANVVSSAKGNYWFLFLNIAPISMRNFSNNFTQLINAYLNYENKGISFDLILFLTLCFNWNFA